MSLWTIELVRTEVGPKPWIFSDRRETWLWRAYKGSDNYSTKARQEMREKDDYLVGSVSARITPRSDALRKAEAACNADDLKNGQQLRETVGYYTRLS